ncbi:hypothetical protein CNEO3_60056 [Clostridium neonatale]|uniref:Uncharacterized protein n=1 Tax=Clostridium neonatale TaxID=137838 RepID=A0AA86JNU4_9CLOT|nr:hypothetical protein CNEO_45167 [Clostridium neonatale]CAI3535924.1 hypothetical protein CNEO4_1130003 [Clostridium neonatale]CAI3563734.1 hypothetical protein CNEO3_120057 [Clostridium neonatale]CAI3572316.1 hypothetical protein CNEO4_120057 [Clostridium neonatale]CAI3579187.1 hypothetical protein CNEO3_130057 [Clostridium neonatale]
MKAGNSEGLEGVGSKLKSVLGVSIGAIKIFIISKNPYIN